MSMSGTGEFGAERRPHHRPEPQETTERLLDAAAEEFLERGFEATRVSNIARRCGVTTGAIYARWPTKSAAVSAALDHLLQQILPEQRLKDFGAAGLQPTDMLRVLGASLVAPNELREVMVQVFGSARNNEAIQRSLRQFLDEEADQLSRMIEMGKDQGLCDPDLSTPAMSLLCQAIGIGTDLLLTAGLADRHIPSEHDWSELVTRLVAAVVPMGEEPPATPEPATSEHAPSDAPAAPDGLSW